MRRTQNKSKAIWERGYNRSHVLWAGKEKLAKVTHDSSHTLKYVWEAAGRRGEATTLSAAKVAAEYAVLLADRQLSLFDDVSVQSTSAQT